MRDKGVRLSALWMLKNDSTFSIAVSYSIRNMLTSPCAVYNQRSGATATGELCWLTMRHNNTYENLWSALWWWVQTFFCLKLGMKYCVPRGKYPTSSKHMVPVSMTRVVVVLWQMNKTLWKAWALSIFVINAELRHEHHQLCMHTTCMCIDLCRVEPRPSTVMHGSCSDNVWCIGMDLQPLWCDFTSSCKHKMFPAMQHAQHSKPLTPNPT